MFGFVELLCKRGIDEEVVRCGFCCGACFLVLVESGLFHAARLVDCSELACGERS